MAGVSSLTFVRAQPTMATVSYQRATMCVVVLLSLVLVQPGAAAPVMYQRPSYPNYQSPPPASPPAPYTYTPPSPVSAACQSSCCPGFDTYASKNLTCLSPFLYDYDTYASERAQFNIGAAVGEGKVAVDMLGEDGILPVLRNDAGTKWTYDVAGSPYLSKVGVSQTAWVFQPCSKNVPHVHPRGVEFVLLVQGDLNLTVVEENGGRAVTVLLSGNGGHLDTYPVPQGLPHAEENLSCEISIMVSTFNSPDAGTVTLGSALAKFPNTVIATSLGISVSDADAYSTRVKGITGLQRDADCMARCGMKYP